MQIRLKIDKSLSKDELLARLPALVKSVAEATLEKARAVRVEMDSALWKQHPVRPVAEAGGEFYEQGRDALSGLYSWLLRSLRVETETAKGQLSSEKYREQVLEGHGVSLGTSITYEQAQEIDSVLDRVPREFLDDKIRTIATDGRFGRSKRRYPNHGRYDRDDKRVVLNPGIFGQETGLGVSKLTHTLLHEIGHGIDDALGLSDKREWRDISGWRYVGDGDPGEGEERMLLADGGRTTLRGRWVYKKGACFPRWYGSRNPKEDFCESFVFALLGDKGRFTGETGEKKLRFVSRVIERLSKGDGPEPGLETAADDEILKSQDFLRYAETRQSSMPDSDDLEALEIAKSEFLAEPCEDLGLEKAEPGAGQLGTPHAFKGMERPGHKYIRREQRPDGSYRYWYRTPSGHHYFSQEALHDEGRHQPLVKTDEEWANYRQNAMRASLEGSGIPEVKRGEHGITPVHFDEAAVPKLVEDTKPDAAMFDPNAPEAAEPAPEKLAQEDWRHDKPSREQWDPVLGPTHERDTEAALKTWEVEAIDPDFGAKDEERGVNLSLRVKLKNDGWAIMKPAAASKLTYANENNNNIRDDMDEHSTVYREALAYSIDRALGWNLVPPTVLRTLKGMGQRHLLAQLKKKWGDNPQGVKAEVVEDIEKNKNRDVSMQFFVDGGKIWAFGGANHVHEVAEDEIVRAYLFDMLINHQDRHGKNVMLVRDQESDKRYGGVWRMVMIDNGYSAGNGRPEARRSFHSDQRLQNAWIDKKTLRVMKRLRDDILDKRRRRKIISAAVRRNVPADQIERIGKRVDLILKNAQRDAKGRVKLPTWRELGGWEQKKYPAKHVGAPNLSNNPFDITGKTALVGQNVEKAARLQKLQDFLHPLLEHLHPAQRKALDNVLAGFEAGSKPGYMDADRVQRFARMLPKRLVHQLFENQMLHHRIGFGLDERRQIDDFVRDYVKRDFVGEFERDVKRNDPELYNKIKRGEVDRGDLARKFGLKQIEKWELRGVLPKEMREHKSKTDRIFEDPAHFGWHAGGYQEELQKRMGGGAEKSQADEPSLLVEL